jgi:hypothetical protein
VLRESASFERFSRGWVEEQFGFYRVLCSIMYSLSALTGQRRMVRAIFLDQCVNASTARRAASSLIFVEEARCDCESHSVGVVGEDH